MVGETRKVWHVVGPDTPKVRGAWYVYNTREEAERSARVSEEYRMSEGTETLTQGPGHLFWAVERPVWEDMPL